MRSFVLRPDARRHTKKRKSIFIHKSETLETKYTMLRDARKPFLKVQIGEGNMALVVHDMWGWRKTYKMELRLRMSRYKNEGTQAVVLHWNY